MKLARWRPPSLVDLMFVTCLLGVGLGLGDELISTDGDFARHLRVGQWILDTRAIPKTDELSFTMAGRPFIPYEWLSEVATAAGYRAGGLSGAVAITVLLFSASAALVLAFMLRRGVDPALAYLTTATGAAFAST